MAMIVRAQLFEPDNHLVSDQQYNELFTMHGAIMLLFATPLFVGFANEIMPLQIGAPDVAFPRLNLLSYYFLADVAGLRPGTAPDQPGSRSDLALSGRRAAHLPAGPACISVKEGTIEGGHDGNDSGRV